MASDLKLLLSVLYALIKNKLPYKSVVFASFEKQIMPYRSKKCVLS